MPEFMAELRKRQADNGKYSEFDLSRSLWIVLPERMKQRSTWQFSRKPKGHDFIIDRRNNQPAVTRHMSATGG